MRLENIYVCMCIRRRYDCNRVNSVERGLRYVWSVFSPFPLNVRSERPHRGCAGAGRSGGEAAAAAGNSGGGHVMRGFPFFPFALPVEDRGGFKGPGFKGFWNENKTNI